VGGELVRTPTNMSIPVGEPPNTKLPSGETYKYSAPVSGRLLELGNDRATAPLLIEYFTPGLADGGGAVLFSA
jgi:hypothetical protein